MNMFNRGGGRGFGGLNFFPPVMKKLLIANIAVFIGGALLGNLTLGGVPLQIYMIKYLALWPIDGGGMFLPWQLFTYMFMHADLSHLFFNMFALWIFGMELENTWGSKKFLIYYTICGLGGGIAHLIISPLLGSAPLPLVGASGAIFGLLIAFGLLFPDRHLYVYFLFPIKAKYFVAIYMAIEFFALSGGSSDGVSHLAHLGGAVVGIVYMLISVGGPTILSNFRSNRRNDDDWGGGGRTPFRPFQRQNDNYVDAEYSEISTPRYQQSEKSSGVRIITQADIDIILEKIHAGGWQSLTEEERAIMLEASQKMNETNKIQ